MFIAIGIGVSLIIGGLVGACAWHSEGTKRLSTGSLLMALFWPMSLAIVWQMLLIEGIKGERGERK